MIKGNEDELLPGVRSVSRVDARDPKPAPSGPRFISDAPLGESWRDSLLRLSLELPLDAALDEIARVFLDGMAPILPDLALGVAVFDEGSAEPVITRRLPEGLPVHRDWDSMRLFPELREERIFSLNDGERGSSLHVACSASFGTLTPFHVQVAERAALVLGSALSRARKHRDTTLSGEAILELRARLVQAEKLASLGEIVAGVVHELNNPLTSILAYSQYLTRSLGIGGHADPGDVERLRRISEAAERVLKFSRDLVAYARPNSEIPSAVHVEEVIDQALRFCDHEFAVHAIVVERAFAPSLPRMLGVAGQLTRVFVNLFTNAVHAMSERGGTLRVEVALDRDGDHIVVNVTDSGCGISPEHVTRVFEPFFTTKRDGRGTGLGLSIVREILEAHGGTVEMNSVAGSGTTFTLGLPVSHR
ncbi:MAG TPA: ATP-binding protein [Polyangiaceae bacterium]